MLYLLCFLRDGLTLILLQTGVRLAIVPLVFTTFTTSFCESNHLSRLCALLALRLLAPDPWDPRAPPRGFGLERGPDGGSSARRWLGAAMGSGTLWAVRKAYFVFRKSRHGPRRHQDDADGRSISGLAAHVLRYSRARCCSVVGILI